MTIKKFNAGSNRSGLQEKISHDWDLYKSYNELVDNSLTSAISEGMDKCNISIYPEGNDLVITDDSGGVEEKDFREFFNFGTSGLGNTEGGISNFGSGLTAASYVLSDGHFRVISNRHATSSGTTVMKTDFSNVEAEEYPDVVEIEPSDAGYEDIEEGKTKIVFPNAWLNITAEKIREVIGRTYNRYLDSSIDTDVQLNCSVNGVPVNPVQPYKLSGSPIIPPRLYPNIKLTGEFCYEDATDEPVYVDILLGYLANDNPEKFAGTDIYCQDKLVEERLTGEKGGFTGDLEWNGKEYSIFRSFNNNRSRTKCVLRFKTEDSDKSVLPWDSSKSEVIMNGYLVEAMVRWARNIATSYRQGYDPLRPQHILPFTGSNASVEKITYDDYNNGEKRIRNGERSNWNTDSDNCLRNQIKDFNEVIDKHERHGIRNPDEAIATEVFVNSMSRDDKISAYKTILMETIDGDSEKSIECYEDLDIINADDNEDTDTNTGDGGNEKTKENNAVDGSKVAKGGFDNEEKVAEKLRNYENSELGRDLINQIGYDLFHVKDVEVRNLSNDVKPDLEIIIYTRNGQYKEYVSIKKVKNADYNQLEKRWVDDFAIRYNWSDVTEEGLKMYVGENGYKPKDLGYDRENLRDGRRFYIDELPEQNKQSIIEDLEDKKREMMIDMFTGRETPYAEWMFVTKVNDDNEIVDWSTKKMSECVEIVNSEIDITSRGNIKLGKLTMQRKGGDNGKKSAQMLQIKYNPLSIFNN